MQRLNKAFILLFEAFCWVVFCMQTIL